MDLVDRYLKAVRFEQKEAELGRRLNAGEILSELRQLFHPTRGQVASRGCAIADIGEVKKWNSLIVI